VPLINGHAQLQIFFIQQVYHQLTRTNFCSYRSIYYHPQ
jgi:hypothetical protein